MIYFLKKLVEYLVLATSSGLGDAFHIIEREKTVLCGLDKLLTQDLYKRKKSKLKNR